MIRAMTPDEFFALEVDLVRRHQHLEDLTTNSALDHVFYVAFIDERVVAFRYVRFFDGVCELFQMFVDTPFRRNGIAERTLIVALDDALTRHCREVDAIWGGAEERHLALFSLYERTLQDVRYQNSGLRFKAMRP
ncbi:GNAT family N-acetyltransferase [Noviherbaspirillum suwonense]|uniref:GNAT family N-acetyltransferase n=1 Tax=Noviherbaspirillum suwonense TaxID=1224511 RepID=UPI0024B87447|nr:GNAT family N-acetyltransferase [Noviherbaspirillum suwonense]